MIGDDEVPGPSDAYQDGMHWIWHDFNWAHFTTLVGAPIRPAETRHDPVVTIDRLGDEPADGHGPCDGTAVRPEQPANFVYLHSAPNADSPLVSDPYLAAAGVEPDGVGTTLAWDWGQGVVGEQYAVAGRQGDLLAVWFRRQKAWIR